MKEGDLGDVWREREKKGDGVFSRGWMGEVLAGLGRLKLEGEEWEVEGEREEKLNWRVIIVGNKEKGVDYWRLREKSWKGDEVISISDASKGDFGMGIGWAVWEDEDIIGWGSLNGGPGLTVEGGEMRGVGEGWKWLNLCYEGGRKRVVVGTDNVGVLRKLKLGRGWCGMMERLTRKWGKLLLDGGWDIELVWVPGHVGLEKNEEVDELAKCGAFEEEDEEWGNVLMWGEWEARRKRLERRSWKEFWVWDRKGEEYFGSGGKGELGHGGERWVSKMLVWLRTNHGGFSGSRHVEGRGYCDCSWGLQETRDHFLLYCKKWDELREEVWRGFDWGLFKREGWVDMEKLLFSEEGVRKVIEFGRRSGWKDRVWKREGWSRMEDVEGMRWKPIREELSGWMGGLSEQRRRREHAMMLERCRRYRERKGLSIWKEGVLDRARKVLAGLGGESDTVASQQVPEPSEKAEPGQIEDRKLRGKDGKLLKKNELRAIEVLGERPVVQRKVLGVMNGNVGKRYNRGFGR